MKLSDTTSSPSAVRAFTIVELLASLAVLSVLMVVLAQVLSVTQRTWGRAKARTEEFRAARAAFDAIATRLSQATLNSYWGYKLDKDGNPVLYQRQSELHYVNGPVTTLLPSATPSAGHAIFFQAPLGESLDASGATVSAATPAGLENLLNSWGWYALYESDLPRRPDFLQAGPAHPEKKRFRLMEFRQTTEKLPLFQLTSDPNGGTMPIPWIEAQTGKENLYKWFRDTLAADSQPVAENILAILIQPVWPSSGGQTGASTDAAPDYIFDTRRHQWPDLTPLAYRSRHQLPPMLRLTLIALDERDWGGIDTAKADELAAELSELVNAKLFKLAADYEKDLQRLEAELVKRRLSFHIFSTAVQIPAAKLMSGIEN
ncbi:MAG: Verru_Chthon cassette protein C [Prosthecobacter sp.]|uniref:Verru_Chthon cassette protein C n=1 Tax=Prosthecobacter sp. TaxID=1965333 RepID=UPI0025D3B59C|nr:Verru_Chthon cassette protein C [Prosthecobacter sp.]MCF7786513.1 Verru_Chthon cassette protein C [Prosthecobacter sp.]